jgi:hypothetical protein
MSTVSGARKRRGTIRSSITRLINRLTILEGKTAEPSTFDLAQDMVIKLSDLDKDFRAHHFQLLDLIDEADEEALGKEQEELDKLDDAMDDANTRVKLLILTSSSSANSPKRLALARRQSQLQKSLTSIHDAVAPLRAATVDVCLIRQFEERLQACKIELKELSTSFLSMNLEDSDALHTSQNTLEKLTFDCNLIIKKLFAAATSSSATTSPSTADSKNSLIGHRSGSNLMLPYTVKLVCPTWRNWSTYAIRSRMVLPKGSSRDSQLLVSVMLRLLRL